MELTDKQIVKNLQDKLAEIKTERDELDELRDDYKDQSEWHRVMYKLQIKQYLLEEILGYE
jgi:asparagine synthetase A